MKLKEIAEEVEVSATRSNSDKISAGAYDETLISETRLLIEHDPFHTLASLRNILIEGNINASIPTISKYLKSMELTRKRLTLVPKEINSQQNVDSRQSFCRTINSTPDNNLVFLGETGFNLHTSKQYGYSIMNTKCFVTVPANRGKNVSLMAANVSLMAANVSLMAAITVNGILSFKIVDSVYIGDIFCDFITNNLRPYFQTNPHSVLVLDNCAFNRRRDVINLPCQSNVSVYILPPYSPQLNLIEENFSCLKANYTSIRPFPKISNEVKATLSLFIPLIGIDSCGW
ncbi:uncharacterized protein LOC136089676 [Hydra vulgaris]|uniref:Uncharacterized protein LOC136089676 n=1 Tax=Hydra vulgaris TaxID=6087 RepID=A0ABM4DBQ5_HYDVU